MVPDADAQLAMLLQADLSARREFRAARKLQNDPRLIGPGRVIRRFKIDEIPQLVNVIRGEMTLVGPRPVVPTEIARYGPYGQIAFAVRPGLTGPWQVSDVAPEDYQRRIDLDVEFAQRHSLGEIVALLLRTPVAVWPHGPGGGLRMSRLPLTDVLRSKWWLIAITTVWGAATGLFVGRYLLVPSGTVELAVVVSDDSIRSAGGEGYGVDELRQVVVALAENPEVADRAAAEVGATESVSIDAESDTRSPVVTLWVRHSDPDVAVVAAEALVEILAEERRRLFAQTYLGLVEAGRDELAQIDAELSALDDQQTATDGRREALVERSAFVSSELATVERATVAAGDSIRSIGPAVIANAPPSDVAVAAIAALAGAVVGFGLAVPARGTAGSASPVDRWRGSGLVDLAPRRGRRAAAPDPQPGPARCTGRGVRRSLHRPTHGLPLRAGAHGAPRHHRRGCGGDGRLRRHRRDGGRPGPRPRRLRARGPPDEPARPSAGQLGPTSYGRVSTTSCSGGRRWIGPRSPWPPPPGACDTCRPGRSPPRMRSFPISMAWAP